MRLGKAGGLVKGAFLAQDLGAKLDHVVRGVLGAQNAVHFLHHPFVAAGDIQDGKGDEQAVSGRVDERRGGLEGAAQIGLALRAQGFGRAAYAGDLGRDGIARRVVGAHRGGGIGDADALDRPRLVGRHALPLDRWASRTRRGPGPRHRSRCPGCGPRRALAHLVHQLDGLFAVAKFGHPGLHRHRDGRAGLDRVQAIGIAQPDQLGDVIQVADTAVGAQRPGRLVLDAGGDLGAVGLVPGVGALDDAAGAAGVVVQFLAQALLVALKDGLARDVGRVLKAARWKSCWWAGRRPRS